MYKLLIICGPTATGKTDLAALLAKQLPAELISADSRQVYTGMDIGTGKDRPPSVVIHGYDLVNPNQDFSLAHYVKFGRTVLTDIWHRRKLPIIVGGTGLYINSLLKTPATAAIPVNPKLRQELQSLTIGKLQTKLKKLNLSHFNQMNYSDQHNPRRLIRAIEIQLSRQVLQTDSLQANSLLNVKPNVLWIGLTAPLPILDHRINDRVLNRANHGMSIEVKKLLQAYSGFIKLPAASATGYRQWENYLHGKLTRTQALTLWQTAERQYARRQLTWFRKTSSINWFNISHPRFSLKVVEFVKNWYRNNQ